MVMIKTTKEVMNYYNHYNKLIGYNLRHLQKEISNNKWALVEEQKIIFDKFWLDNCELTPKFSKPLKDLRKQLFGE